MTLRPQIVILVLATVLALPLAYNLKRLRAAGANLTHASAMLDAAHHDVSRVLELRQQQQTISEQRRPEQDVIARVNNALERAGLPALHFAGVRQDSDSAMTRQVSGPTYRRQQVRLTLSAMTVRDLGAFLDVWLETQPLWVPVRLDLNHARGQTDPPRFDITIILATTYVAYE